MTRGAWPSLELLDFVGIGGRVPRSFAVVPAAEGNALDSAGWLVVGAQEDRPAAGTAAHRHHASCGTAPRSFWEWGVGGGAWPAPALAVPLPPRP